MEINEKDDNVAVKLHPNVPTNNINEDTCNKKIYI